MYLLQNQIDMSRRNTPRLTPVEKHHAQLSRNPPSQPRINHLSALWLNPSALSWKPAICRVPLHTGYHSRTSDTELIAPTRQVRCTIVQGPNRKFRPDVLTRGDMGILEVKRPPAVERDGA